MLSGGGGNASSCGDDAPSYDESVPFLQTYDVSSDHGDEHGATCGSVRLFVCESAFYADGVQLGPYFLSTSLVMMVYDMRTSFRLLMHEWICRKIY